MSHFPEIFRHADRETGQPDEVNFAHVSRHRLTGYNHDRHVPRYPSDGRCCCVGSDSRTSGEGGASPVTNKIWRHGPDQPCRAVRNSQETRNSGQQLNVHHRMGLELIHMPLSGMVAAEES
jgi:hypothetical protein